MAELPVDALTAAEFFEWYKCQEELGKLKSKEAMLRQRVFRHMVPNPEEGTNSVELDTHPLFAGMQPTGYVLKAAYKINREVDDGALTVLTTKLVEAKINIEKLIKRKPSLAVGEYRKLTKEEQQLFDQVLIVKPGAPDLDIVLPASRKPK